MTDEMLPLSLPAPDLRPKGAPKALDGIRIIDFTRMIAGPFGTLLLADLGADVIKIENPETGDDSRSLRSSVVGKESAMFLWANRNKRSLALDLRLPGAQEVVRDLVKSADVVVENYSVGVMKRFGLSYEELSRINSKIIYCAISAFGRQGRFASRPGYDGVAQAESGFLSLNGYPDQPPVRAGASIIDISAGMMASNAVLGALMARERHGVGQYVEVALFDDGIIMSGQAVMHYLITGEDQVRCGNGSPVAEPVGLFDAKDGQVYLACANDNIYQRFMVDVLERPELAKDLAFSTNAARLQNRQKLHLIIADCFAKGSKDMWLEKGLKSAVPIGIVRSIADACSSDEIKEQRLLSRIPHPMAGYVPNIAAPFRFSGTPLVDPIAAPLLGQHSEVVLREVLGYDEARIETLAKSGTFGVKRAVSVPLTEEAVK